MEENKYYLNNKGLITLISKMSETIKNHTSGEINEDSPQNNFPTVGAVVNYLKNRKNLVINQQYYNTTSSNIETDTKEYNGEQEVEMNMKIVPFTDIDNLFN